MRRRAPTYRERWVKNDDSGTLGFLFFKIKTQFNRGLRFRFIQKRNVKLTNQYFKNNTKDLCPKVSKEVFVCCCQWQKQTNENGKPFGGAMGQSPIFQNT